MKRLAVLIFLTVLSSTTVGAHSGRTDQFGGHNCRVGACAGTYHYHNGGPAYQPVYTPPVPICKVPDLTQTKGSTTFSTSGCNQDVTMTWNDSGSLEYSVAISKTPGADPGPNSDTANESYTFRDITPGKWYINLKAKNSCGWGRVWYWTVDVPPISPEITTFSSQWIDTKTVKISYGAKCANNLTISGIGVVNQKNNSVLVYPKKDTVCKLVANGRGGTEQKEIAVVIPTPTPTVTRTQEPAVTLPVTKKSWWQWLFGVNQNH